MSVQEAIKKEIELSAASHFRGYQRLGVNITKYENGFSRDWHEGIDFYREGQVVAPSAQPMYDFAVFNSRLMHVPLFTHRCTCIMAPDKII